MLTIMTMTMTMTMATFALNDDYNVKDDLDVGKETIHLHIGKAGAGAHEAEGRDAERASKGVK